MPLNSTCNNLMTTTGMGWVSNAFKSWHRSIGANKTSQLIFNAHAGKCACRKVVAARFLICQR